MQTVKVDLPAALLHAANLGRAAELCRTPLAAFMEFAAAHEVSPIRYGVTQLEEDRRTLSELDL